MNSLKRAIRYSLMPHELGYCGPDCNESKSKIILRDYLSGENYPEEKIRELLDEFIGAVSYYKLIAEKNNIDDYYDEKVVEAYWLGNDLLENVSVDDLKEMILNDFVGAGRLSKDKAQEIIGRLPEIAYAHHTFHVFFIGAVTNRVKLEGENKDKCRPSWAKVIGEAEEPGKLNPAPFNPIHPRDKPQGIPERCWIKVKISKLFSDEETAEADVIWDKVFVPELKMGDIVSCHWGRISEKITRGQLDNLIKYTGINYKALMGDN
ncbi:MAG: hypothetical protein A2469_03360 [Candidatus Magasanikbacteria bacterium RIFOXYC2_FULL_40_16]|uniref:Uncharacterized protein n=1 Tax=Candidatus Magasanikbacteria bacterium RIFOXYC2_FULL_40_16 TaxID=1798703 RepID=A0A1F6P000_9BACT|nr:MAG: hypothetical protein A2469_03360 [Candidatus Magasanikbacteria bacterium RIFOXYC2_FULL_40_16]